MAEEKLIDCGENYNILNSIGGYDNVLNAIEKETNEEVVLKLINTDDNDYEKFEIEKKLVSIASELNIGPRLFDTFKCNYKNKEYYVLVLEKLNNSLKDIFIENDNIVPREYLERIFDVLVKAYQNGIHYKDTWIDNIMLNNNSDIILIDMGWPSLYGDNLNVENSVQKSYGQILKLLTFRYKIKNNKQGKKDIIEYMKNKYETSPVETEKEKHIREAHEEQLRLLEERLKSRKTTGYKRRGFGRDKTGEKKSKRCDKKI